MKNIFSLMLLFLGVSFASYAQGSRQEELGTDRPDRSQGIGVVPPATVQIEAGFEFQKDGSQSVKQKEYLYPTTLFRIGIIKNAELRINTDLKKETSGQTGEEKGFSDVHIGTKVRLYKGKAALPQVGILGQLTLSAGDKSFRPPHAAPEVRLLFSNKLTEKFELQYNAGYRKRPVQEENRGEALYTVNGSLKLTEKLTYFAEVFGQKPKADKAEHGIDNGLLFKLFPNLQLDIIGGMGINKQAPDYFAGGGVTLRIPE